MCRGQSTTLGIWFSSYLAEADISCFYHAAYSRLAGIQDSGQSSFLPIFPENVGITDVGPLLSGFFT